MTILKCEAFSLESSIETADSAAVDIMHVSKWPTFLTRLKVKSR